MMTLYSGTTDPYSHRCRIVLFEKGMDFQVIDVDLANKPEDLAVINPYNQVPVLVERDLVLSEANIINEYIDERFPHPQLMPPDPVMRARGADWVYSYMRGFYRDDTRPTGWNNAVFDKVGMPHILYELQGEQVFNHETHQLELHKPGRLSVAEYDALVGDLTNFMAYMAEPAKQKRNQMGWFVLLFLGVLTVLTYKLKKAYWRDIH